MTLFNFYFCRWFSNFITLCILINTLALAIYDYRDRDSQTVRNKVTDMFNVVLTFIFLLEALIKIIGMGLFIGENTYLRDGWNIIDIVIVISG